MTDWKDKWPGWLKVLPIAILFVFAASKVCGSAITRGDIKGSSVSKFIVTGTTAVSVSVTAGTTIDQVIFLEFHSENATTSVVGYDEGTSPVAYIPIKEDTTYFALPINGNAHVICSNCSASASVTVTVRTY